MKDSNKEWSISVPSKDSNISWTISDTDKQIAQTLDTNESIGYKIDEIFGLKTPESIEFKWKMLNNFRIYKEKLIPIINRLKIELKDSDNRILQEDEDLNHWFNKHTKNVVIRWIFYALMKWIDPVPVIIAATCHDLKHINIPWGGDKNHWPQAVPLIDIVVKAYNENIWSDVIDENTKNQIKDAVRDHMSSHGEPDNKPIAQCLNDADRTRLAWRDWYMEKFFSTDAAKIIASWKKEKFIKYFEDIWIDYDKTSGQ